MQIGQTSQLQAYSPAVSRARTGATEGPAPTAGVAAEGVRSAGIAGSVSAPAARPGLQTWSDGFNAEAGRVQLTADYLDQGIGQLKSLKSSLSQQIASGVGDVALQRRVDRFAQLWQQRSTQTAGALASDLSFDPSAEAQRQFRIPGMTVQAMQAGDAESLVFAFSGASRQQPSVVLDEGLDAQEVVRRFDHALAVSGVRADADEDGALVFSVSEAAWPALKDSLAIRGGGMRWPTGQFSRVRPEPVPEAVQPETWAVDTVESMRASLQGTVNALKDFSQARRNVDGVLERMNETLSGKVMESSAERARTFADAFRNMGQSPSYASLGEFSAALSGVRRDRILAVLGAD
ncbi:hypothetical protein [Methyloversatilis thermotolerans]|uniref:hypothetical protein n=1 Tax=Methyloversatilis thermotolerans TaxID=1346290 RepID=UPI000361D656|nr:hypothetical protein [Methyloversatilis thermotolerans]